MSIIASVNDPTRIGEIGELIHDCWFNVEDVGFDPTESRLSIKFARLTAERSLLVDKFWILKRWEVPILDCYLNVHNVEQYQISDTERVGTYNFNDLEYDAENRIITITTGIPIGMEITVRKVEVDVEETDHLVRIKRIWTVFDLRSI